MSINNFSNFLFSLITRSLRQYYPADGNPIILDEGMHSLVLNLIQTFVENVVGKNVSEFNQEIALWLSDLLYIIERGQVIDFIHHYYFFLIGIDTSDTLDKKLHFVRSLTDHEFYVPLNCPVPIEIDGRNGILKKFRFSFVYFFIISHWNYFSGIVFDLIKRTYCSPTIENTLRHRAIEILRTILWNHQMDNRIKNSTKKYIASSYVPALSLALDYRNIILNSDREIKLDWMQSLAWILQYSRDETLEQFFLVIDENELHYFVNILKQLIESFHV